MLVTSWNVQGLRHKTEAIQGIVNDDGIDVLCIQEHWLPPDVQIPFLNTIGITYDYQRGILPSNSGRRARGGIAVLVSSKIANNTTLVDANQHYIHVKIDDIDLFNVYFPPSASDNDLIEFLDHIDSLVESKVVVVGDFNARLGPFANDTATNPRGRAMLKHMAEASYFLQTPSRGRFTSVQGKGRGIPDHLNMDVNSYIIRIANTPMMSDHMPLQFKIHDPVVNTTCYTRWNIRKFETEGVPEAYDQALAEQLNTIVTQSNASVDALWSDIKQTFENALEATVGKLTIDPARKPKVLRSPESELVLQELKECAMILINMPRSCPQWPTALSRRKMLYKQYVELINSLKQAHFSTILGNYSLKQNRQALIKRLACKHKRATRSTKSLDPNNMTDHRAHFMTTFGALPTVTIPPEISEGNQSNLVLVITEDDVRNAISELTMGKAAGQDGLTPEAFVYGGCCVNILVTLFNRCIQQRNIPVDWKTALICPVYKKGDHTLATNYRPIALTSVARRIHEKCLARAYIKSYEALLSDSQCGFRPGRNTQQQIFVLQETLLSNQNAEEAFMDLEAAYDTVPRGLLWNKLQTRYGLPAVLVDTLKVLFDDNSSILVVKGKRSEPIPNTRGLLQGSSLSPILFNFFIDDLIGELESLPGVKTYGKKVSALAFADDVAIVAANHAALQLGINAAEKWSIDNGMKFNRTKCVHLTATSMPLLLYNEPIPQEASAVYLGMTFNSNGLDLEASAMQRTKKARLRSEMLRKHGFNIYGLTTTAASVVYKTFVRSMMEYGLCFFDKTKLLPFQKAQEHALRTMFSAQRNTSRAAMHAVSKITPMLERSLILQASFYGLLHNSNDASVPAV